MNIGLRGFGRDPKDMLDASQRLSAWIIGKIASLFTLPVPWQL
jgi:hypothetical protein